MIGAEVLGVDLARLDDTEFDRIEAALLDRQVLFFRDQELDLDQHKALGERFGPLHIHPSARRGHRAIPRC